MNILVISSRFGQKGVPSSYHIDDRVIELIKENAKITVITENEPNYLDKEILDKIDVYSIESSGVRLVRLVNRLKKRIFKCKDRFGNWNWEQNAVKFVLKNLNLTSFDIVYSTGGPAVAHLVAYNLSKRKKIKWIAEIQDPLIFEEIQGSSYQASKKDIKKLKLAEAALKNSVALICLTKRCQKHYQMILNKSEVYSIYPGSNILNLKANILLKNHKQGKITFFHSGTLGAERNLDTFVKAVLKLNIENAIELNIAGNIDTSIKRVIQSNSFINYLGTLPREEIKKQITINDICLVVQNLGSVSKLTIPSKFYEYAALKASIFFLGYLNDEISKNSFKYEFYYADQNSLENVIGVLQKIVEDYFGGKLKKAVPINFSDATHSFLTLCENVITNAKERVHM